MILAGLPGASRDTLLRVMSPDTAGSLMVAEYPSVSIDGTAADARDSVRALSHDRLLFTYVFVVGAGDQLVGQISMVELALAEADAPIESLSVPIVATVSTETEARECARLRRHYNLTQLPVVHDGRLIGVIAADAVLGNMIIAGSISAAAPLFLRRIGVDLAVASAVVVTTFTDVFGFLLFLGLARAAITLIIQEGSESQRSCAVVVASALRRSPSGSRPSLTQERGAAGYGIAGCRCPLDGRAG